MPADPVLPAAAHAVSQVVSQVPSPALPLTPPPATVLLHLPGIAPGQLLPLAVDAVLLAGLYAVVAAGLGLVHGVLRVVNLGHGGALLGGAYLTWGLARVGVNPLLAAPVVLGVCFAAGVALHQWLVRFLPRGEDGGAQTMLVLFGLWLLLRGAVRLLFGPAVRTVPVGWADRVMSVGGVPVAGGRLVAFTVAVVVLAGLGAWLRWTDTGRVLRAAAQDPAGCTLVGADVERMDMLAFGIGTALGGLGGLLWATVFTFGPGFGTAELVKGFVVVFVGGLGSMAGLAAGALVLAAAETFGVLVLPFHLTAMVGFVLLVATMLVRPRGLLGAREPG